MSTLALYAVTVALTAFAVFLGDRTLFKRLHWYESAVIGFAAVTLGDVAQVLGAPATAVLGVPAGVGVVLLYLLMAAPLLQWFLTLCATAVFYTGLHLVASRFADIHTLIPTWPMT